MRIHSCGISKNPQNFDKGKFALRGKIPANPRPAKKRLYGIIFINCKLIKKRLCK